MGHRELHETGLAGLSRRIVAAPIEPPIERVGIQPRELAEALGLLPQLEIGGQEHLHRRAGSLPRCIQRSLGPPLENDRHLPPQGLADRLEAEGLAQYRPQVRAYRERYGV